MTAQFSRLGAVIFVCRNKHMKEFDEVFVDKTKYGTKLKTSDYKECGKYPIIDQGQETIAGYTDAEDGVFKEVPVIIFGDHTRVIKYVDKPFFLGADGVKVLRSKYLDANYRYLFYALLDLKIPNTGYNRHFKWLKEAKIQYPTLKQQEKVVGILDKIEKVIAARNKQLNALDELIQARFVELFGDPTINTKKYPLKLLPEIAEYWNGLTYKPDDVADKGTIVLRSSNIQNMTLDFEDIVRVNCKIGEKKYVHENDILMCSRNGSARLVGKVALIKNIEEPMSFGAFILIIRSAYYPYLMTYFQMPAFRAQIVTGATTTINQITGRMLDNVKLPVPDMYVVNQFADFVNQVNKSKVEIQKALEKTQLLFDSLMQQYFG